MHAFLSFRPDSRFGRAVADGCRANRGRYKLRYKCLKDSTLSIEIHDARYKKFKQTWYRAEIVLHILLLKRTDVQLYCSPRMQQEPGRFKIPKMSVPIICRTIASETINGEIFLVATASGGYTTHQILEFFNSDGPFFPVRLSSADRPGLLRKASINHAIVPDLAGHLQDETSITLAQKKDAIVHFPFGESVRATVILDLPEESCRILDLLSLPNDFFAALIENTYSVINSNHVYKIEEL